MAKTALELLEQHAVHAREMYDRVFNASPVNMEQLRHTSQRAHQADLALLVVRAHLEAHRTPAELAAQDMLEALRDLIGRIERDERIEMRHLRPAREAIAKAEGRPHG